MNILIHTFAKSFSRTWLWTMAERERERRNEKCLCKFSLDVYFAPFSSIYVVRLISLPEKSPSFFIARANDFWIHFDGANVAKKITAITFFSWMKYATQFTYANVLIQLKMWQQQHAHFTPCFQKVTNPPIANWSRVVQETILEIAWISKRNHLNAASLIVLWLVFVGSNSEIAFDSKKNLFYFYLLIIMKIFEE